MTISLYLLFTLSTLLNCIYAQKEDCAKCSCLKNKSSSWLILGQSSNRKDFLVRGDSLKNNNSNLKNILKTINSKNFIRVKLLKIKNHIPYIKIVNTTFFTQKIGTTGCLAFLSTLVYDITEIKGIRKVYVDFMEGDHSGPPGFFNRDYFKTWYTICN